MHVLRLTSDQERQIVERTKAGHQSTLARCGQLEANGRSLVILHDIEVHGACSDVNARRIDLVDLHAGARIGRLQVDKGGRLSADRILLSGEARPFDRIAVVGDEVTLLETGNQDAAKRDFDQRHRQLFGDHTTNLLSTLCVGIVGVSGTGSPLVEMLARLGVGQLVLVDDDRVEFKNLNRIMGSTRHDAETRQYKVKVIEAHVAAMGLGTIVTALPVRIEDGAATAALGVCDVVFGCMDSVLGRVALGELTARCTSPYLDLGVRIDADGQGGVSSISAVVHYLKPGGSSLRTRGTYDANDVHAEHLFRANPEQYADQLARGYIRGVRVDSPAVISVNTAIAAAGVNELLARLHPYRSRPNAEFAVQRLLISHGRWVQQAESEPDTALAVLVGRGPEPQDRMAA